MQHSFHINDNIYGWVLQLCYITTLTPSNNYKTGRRMLLRYEEIDGYNNIQCRAIVAL